MEKNILVEINRNLELMKVESLINESNVLPIGMGTAAFCCLDGNMWLVTKSTDYVTNCKQVLSLSSRYTKKLGLGTKLYFSIRKTVTGF